MNRLFNPENPFWNFMSKIMDAVMLSLLWLLGSLPIFTIGASTTALFQFTLKQADDEEGYVWKSFWKAYRANFLPATGLWLVMAAVGTFLAVDFYACVNFSLPGGIRILCFGVVAGLGLIYLLTLIYVFPILSRFPVKAAKIPWHALVMSVGNPGFTLMILAVYGVFLAVIYSFPLMAVFSTGLSALFTSYFYRMVFRRYMAEEEDPR